MTVRLAGHGVREVALVGAHGGMRVEELLLRASAALGVVGGEGVALRCESRLLKAEETLAEAGVSPTSAVVLHVGRVGGMPGIFAAPAPAADGTSGSDEELQGVLGALLGRFSQDVGGIEVAVQRLHALHDGAESPRRHRSRSIVFFDTR